MTDPVTGKRKSAIKSRRNKDRHSFYLKAMDEADGLDFELARGVQGIDDEIALLRVKIKSLLENDPENVKLIMDATSTLARLVMTRYKISADQKKALSNAISNVLGNLAIPLGIKYLP
ncbi:MAG TPA: hypothetical protein VMW64_01740 [Dehalococcoidia bacterium]|nr:hypothetical protein [Dehalococcoidia bacterium]